MNLPPLPSQFQMTKTPVVPVLTLSTSLSYLHLCSHHLHLPKAQEIHSLLITTSLLSTSPLLTTSLISLYSHLSLPSLSLSSFLSSPLPPNLFTFNSLLSSLSSHHLPSLSLLFFRRLRSHPHLLIPNEFTFPSILKSLADLRATPNVQTIHSLLFKLALNHELFSSSALVRSYLKLGLFEHAHKAFDELPERDVVLWNAMVNGFAQMGRFREAIEYFNSMRIAGMVPSRFTVTGVLSVFTATSDVLSGRKTHGFVWKVGFETDVAVSNALIDLYGKCHEVGDAVAVFGSMAERDLLSWNSMVSSLVYDADHERALEVFCRMRRAGVLPDPVTIAAVLPACSQVAGLMHGREIHAFMLTSGMSAAAAEDVFVVNALMDMYAKSGALPDAHRVFNQMPNRDTASWNIMIHGYAAHGRGKDALDLFDVMCASGAVPDEVTFVGLLSACSHSGLVEPGREILRRMESEFGVVPTMEHYSCMVDLLGRAGRLEESREVAETAREAGAWRAYLAACRVHGETKEAARAAERVVGMEPLESGGYVLLANAYGWEGRFGEVEEVRGEMRRKGVRKVVGCSWVEVAESGTVHTFVNRDLDHPEAAEIYRTLHGLIGGMRECGYVPDVMICGE